MTENEMSTTEEKQPYGYVDLDSIDTTGPAPDEEPARQHFFMAKCREIIKEKELEMGRKQLCYVKTLGCPKFN